MPKIDIDNYIEQSGMRKARFGGYEPEDVHQAMEDLCADYEQHLTAMTSELRTLRQENDALRRHAQGLVMQNQTLSTQNATLAGQVDKLQSYRANLETQFSTVKERSLSLGGAEIVETSMRSYPDGTVLPHVLGSVGKILREQWVADDYALRRKGYAMNDLIGRSGLEAVYEDRLRGQDGSLQVVKDSDGVIQSSQVVEKPQPGQTVMLTVDADFQKEVQAALENRILTLQQTKPAHSGQEDNAGAVVVLLRRRR